ncbi:MAG: DUF3096 domain-containing protein [Candidatus Shapirobacteria bacterium]|jgi:uncharacterized membrane protein HdeD (DUF308 family)|nr:DUF3096 domain-containing protein [Candidatus Shapirobacteria bacterium]
MILKNLSPILSLVFGILVLLNPKLLSTLVGLYLIISGLLALGVINF